MIQIQLTAFRPSAAPQTYILSFCDKWSEVPLHAGIKLAQAAERVPEALHEHYRQVLANHDPVASRLQLESTLTDEQKAKDLPMLYADILQLLVAPSDQEAFAHNLLPYMSPRYVEKLFDKVALPFVIGLLFFPEEQAFAHIIQQGHFEIDGQQYQLPPSRLIPIGDQNITEYLAQATAVEFCETADLDLAARKLQGGKLQFAANIVAILCRPAGEPYNENTVLTRVPLFQRKLTMDAVWAVFFCIATRYTSLALLTHTYLNMKAQTPTVATTDTLPATAGTAA